MLHGLWYLVGISIYNSAQMSRGLRGRDGEERRDKRTRRPRFFADLAVSTFRRGHPTTEQHLYRLLDRGGLRETAGSSPLPFPRLSAHQRARIELIIPPLLPSLSSSQRTNVLAKCGFSAKFPSSFTVLIILTQEMFGSKLRRSSTSSLSEHSTTKKEELTLE